MAAKPVHPRIVVGPVAAAAGTRERVVTALALLLALALGAVAMGVYEFQSNEQLRGRTDQLGVDLAQAESRIETLQQQLAVAERNAQVTDTANGSLRDEIVTLQNDIVGLRADVEFYKRLLGVGGSSNGLAVHALHLEATRSARVYRFVLTLSQNLKKASVVTGAVELTIEGVSEDRPLRLDSDALRVQSESGELSFEFKYFQQLTGSIALPEGFDPDRIGVRLLPESGRRNQPVSREFIWTELLESEDNRV